MIRSHKNELKTIYMVDFLQAAVDPTLPRSDSYSRATAAKTSKEENACARVPHAPFLTNS